MRDLVKSLGIVSVREFLEETKMYQKDLAVLLGCHLTSIERWQQQGTPHRVGLLLASLLAHYRHDLRPAALLFDMQHFVREAKGERATIRGQTLSAYRYALIKTQGRS